MNILILGDVMGPSGRKAISQKLPHLIKKKKIDFVIANGENAADSGLGLTKKNIELAARYTQIDPEGGDSFTDYTFALSKYFVENFLKVQTDVSYIQTEHSNTNNIMYRFQVEMSF